MRYHDSKIRTSVIVLPPGVGKAKAAAAVGEELLHELREAENVALTERSSWSHRSTGVWFGTSQGRMSLKYRGCPGWRSCAETIIKFKMAQAGLIESGLTESMFDRRLRTLRA